MGNRRSSLEETESASSAEKFVGDYNCVHFRQQTEGKWNPWNGCIHYQLSFRPIVSSDVCNMVRYTGIQPNLHFVYAENGYLVDTNQIGCRVLVTVKEGEAQIYGRTVSLNCRKELQKLLAITWHSDGRPPSAEDSHCSLGRFSGTRSRRRPLSIGRRGG